MRFALCALRFAFFELRRERDDLKPRCFGEAQHDVHVLDRLAGRALDQVVDDAEDHQVAALPVFLHRDAAPADLARWLDGLLGAGDPAFAVLGNHDVYEHSPAEIEAVLERAGVRMIGGDAAVVRRGSASAGIAGIDYQNWWKPFPVEAAMARIPVDALPILAAHTPCVFPRAAAAGFEVVLCGHTHGGQIRFPGIGALFIPARYGRRYQMGLYRSSGSYLHVHPGLGGHPALRVACPPEITRIVLRK